MSTATRRIFTSLSVLSVLLTLGFIFGNSCLPQEESAELSGNVLSFLQRIFGTESAFAKFLSTYVRKLAHFTEFFALGACSTWCYLSYCRFAVGLTLPATTVIFVPILDEFLQGSVEGRATELLDLVIDTAGGLTGVLVGLVLAAAVLAGLARRKKRLKGE